VFLRGRRRRWTQADLVGSTRGLTNSSEAVTDSRETDAWGMGIAASGSTATPFGFVGGQGYQADADSGLLLLGAMLTRRWTTPAASSTPRPRCWR
jgi:hypothetical protein